MAEQVAITKVIEVDVKASAQAAAHLKQIADGMEPIKNAADKAGNSIGSMLTMMRGFVGFQILDMVGGTVLKFASAIQEASDRSKLLEERMKLVTGSSVEAGNAFQQIVDISIRQGRELDAVAKLYEKVQRSSEQLALTQRGVAVITEGVAASLRLSGASTQEANAAMLQFAQALASGKLGGDEFRSLMENNSVLMQNFAKELGTTMGGLREMSKEGELNAGKLREAMLKVGEDGKNMMQRMIEQADKLPKTFEQAVTGAKAALVDLVNALQQSGDKAEGVFTGIVRRLTESMRESAVRLRDYALINEEIAKQLEKQLKTDQPEAPFESRYMMENLERKRLAEEGLQRAQRQLEIAKEANKAAKDWDKSLLGLKFSENVARAKGELLAVEKILARMSSQDAGDIQGGGFTTGKVTETGTGEKKKGRKPDTAVDIIEKIRSDLEGDALRIQTMIDGETKASSGLEEKLQEIDKVQAGKLSSTFIEAEKASLRRLQAFNEEQQRVLDDIIEGPKRVEASNKEVERLYKNHIKELEKIKDDVAKDRRTQDPFIGAEAEVDRLRKILDNPQTSAEMAEIIKERMHQVRTKAAAQLLGEKDPLKTIAEQMADNWASAFDRMEIDMLDFSKSAKDIVGDLVVSLLRDFARLQLKESLQPLMEGGKGLMKQGVQFLVDYFKSASGSAWNNGVQMFANGGILGGPTMFAHGGGLGVAGEAGPEAVMPLKRGSDGNLGLGATPVTVNVFNNSKGATARTEETTNASGERQIDVIIEEKVETMIGGGRLDNVMGTTYGISRRGR